MRKSRNIKELLDGGGERLTSLKRRLGERSRVLEQVMASLPKELSAAVASAGLERQELTVGAINAAWATRLRYASDLLRERVGAALGVEILRVRIRVQPEPRSAAVSRK
ncbi:MAG TPA: DciA family protein [Steroidobacteraceae bacterium]|nr:DciA family protein [Steroidobacteraceae bacterium]